MEGQPKNSVRPWRWIPTLYFTQGLPYVAVTSMAEVLYKNLHLSNTEVAFYTSWLGFPWVIKPLWAPLVEMFGGKRLWIVVLQLLMGAACAAVALVIPAPHFVQLTFALFFLLALMSATHDIAADGFYMLAQAPEQQAAFVGVRSTCYRLAILAGQSGLVWLAGRLVNHYGQSAARAWVIVFVIVALLLFAAGAFHAWALPRPEDDRATRKKTSLARDFWDSIISFFAKPYMGRALFFLLVYRLAEAQALKLVRPMLLDARSAGGLGLDTEAVGLAYGWGVAALLIGGITGGWLISRHGLKRMLWPMIFAMHVPIVIFLVLAVGQPTSFSVICAGLAVEQFGYGFGFTAYMVFMMMLADGERKTAHYAFCTGFMALGLMLPGLAAGWIEDHVGYPKFFLWVLVCTLPSFLAVAWLRIDPGFGRKTATVATAD